MPVFSISDTVKTGLIVAGAVVIAAIAAWAGWKLFFADHAAAVAHDQAQIHAVQALRKAEGDAGAKAANTVAGAATKETIIHDTTRDHYVEITRQPGADDLVPDAVDNAFRRAICVREAAARLPDCQRLQEAGAR